LQHQLTRRFDSHQRKLIYSIPDNAMPNLAERSALRRCKINPRLYVQEASMTYCHQTARRRCFPNFWQTHNYPTIQLLLLRVTLIQYRDIYFT
jgi:hypothetical protein